MNSPKISIVTPTFNSIKDVEECILSVGNQTYSNKEHLLVDANSQDGTLQVIQKYATKYPHIRYISEMDSGIYDAMNKGIDMSSGEWIHFLGSDDTLFEKNTLSDIFNEKACDEYDVIYGNIFLKKLRRTIGGKYSSCRIMADPLCHQAIFHRKNVFNLLGKYSLKYKLCADWDFNLKLFNSNIPILYINKTIAIFNENGASGQNIDQAFMNDHNKILRKYYSVSEIFFHKLVSQWYYRILSALKYPDLALRIIRIKYRNKKTGKLDV